MTDTRFIVSKNRFPVTIDMRDGNRLTGHFFLHFAKDETGVPETPIDLINGETRFIVFDGEENGICFVGKDSILRILYTEDTSSTLDDSVENFSTSILVAMSDGQQISGDVAALLPEEHTRLFDLLNRDEYKFLAVQVNAKEKMLVNMDYINSVTTQ